ncbi:hypothetical protein QUA62_16255 [Microcoleus sp. MON1_C1]|uniref:hypothetical protein n=1 Tax=Microcoleus sp. MON1_C1 TaxID=2818827 RepID=UPI002FD3A383
MLQTVDNPTTSPAIEQRFTWRGLTWHQFNAIQAGFEDVANVRLFYCDGVLAIAGTGRLHEAIRCLMRLLTGQYFLKKNCIFSQRYL